MALSIDTSGEGDAMSTINVTPLVDVMLVLLIIFIITIPVIVPQIHLNLPTATNVPTVTKPENITVSIDKDGTIYWNTKKLANQADLKTELRSIVTEDPQPEVHIRGDKDTRYLYVGQVLVAAQEIGIRKVAFLTIPDHLGVQ
ncbi:MAG: biopolymer transporter ExbD [Gammaproteobacteria bacterium]|nr:biopolymer transporter ExbD [Gammaproteobacteria bacterium]MDE2348767.1 biopolymer transporter ExbD [Gammaproteobacteria bacterium]